MTALSTFGEIVVTGLALEGVLAIARRLNFVGEWKMAAGDAFVWMLRLALAQAARKAVTEYAGPYLSDWVGLCGWAAFTLAWLLAVWLQKEAASRVGVRHDVKSP